VSSALSEAIAAAGARDVHVHADLESERAWLSGEPRALAALSAHDLVAVVRALGYDCHVDTSM
jgi:hypothetical protein